MADNGQRLDRGRAATEERQRQVIKLRAEGLDYAEIADQLGYVDAQAAREALRRAQAHYSERDVERLRDIEEAKLRCYMQGLLRELNRPHYVVQWGKVVMDPDHPDQPLHDSGAVVSIYRELRLLSERYSKLRGLDAPLRTIVEEITQTMVEAERRRIAAMADELERQYPDGVPMND